MTLVTHFTGTDGTDRVSGTITLFGKRKHPSIAPRWGAFVGWSPMTQPDGLG